jgi:peptidyl-tRNA hydrolase
MSSRPAKLYVLIREDLPQGSQLAQVVHGQDEFRELHPELHREWRSSSNTVAILGVKDEVHLHSVRGKAEARGIPLAIFLEPDLGDQATCLVLAPSPHTRRLCSSLPLAGSHQV